jgi:hypothetical protein
VRTAGVSDRVVPVCIAIDVGRRSRPCRNGELRLLAQVLEALLRADALDLLRPRRFHPGRSGKVLAAAVLGADKSLLAKLTREDLAALLG